MITSFTIFLVGFIGLILLVAWIAGRPITDSYDDMSPIEIVEERYALGEIDDETYDQLCSDLD
jgi:uncharacterized membrane protein